MQLSHRPLRGLLRRVGGRLLRRRHRRCAWQRCPLAVCFGARQPRSRLRHDAAAGFCGGRPRRAAFCAGACAGRRPGGPCQDWRVLTWRAARGLPLVLRATHGNGWHGGFTDACLNPKTLTLNYAALTLQPSPPHHLCSCKASSRCGRARAGSPTWTTCTSTLPRVSHSRSACHARTGRNQGGAAPLGACAGWCKGNTRQRRTTLPCWAALRGGLPARGPACRPPDRRGRPALLQ